MVALSYKEVVGMSVVFAGLAPHPPILIPDVGKDDREQVSLTNQALTKLAGLLVASEPDILILISPHGPVFSDAIAILSESVIEGDFEQFGAPHIKFKEEINMDLGRQIQIISRNHDIMVALIGKEECNQYGISPKLDHGITVPLYYFRKVGLDVPLVPITIGMLPYEDLYKFGFIISEASRKLDKKIAIVASGDLSHRLTPQAPAGYNPHGKEFDEYLISALKKFEVERVLDVDSKLIEKAGECGLRPIVMMLGALDGLDVKSNVISYEGPFGVGYCVASFIPTGLRAPSKIDTVYQKRAERLQGIQEQEHPLVKLARRTIETQCKDNRRIKAPKVLSPEMEKRAGVFVSIKKHGQLRGCIGTTQPTQANLAEEIIQNAISAAFYDSRFFPIDEDELKDLSISVDVLGEPEGIDCIAKLDPVKYGVIVRQGNKSGLLLPDLDGVDTAEEQVTIAKRKAGIVSDDHVELSRFEVTRYV